jgi:hypothetical protein
MDVSPVHLHLMLNHVPVFLMAMGVGLVAVNWVWKQPAIGQLAMSLVVLSALSFSPVFLTGKPTDHLVDEIPTVSEDHIHAHAGMATRALWLTSLAGFLALCLLGLDVKGTRVPGMARRAAWVVMLLALGAMVYTGYIGGQIRHSEVREPVPAAFGR